MKRHDPHFDPDLDALLERGRIIQRVPDVVRARSLCRARAIMAGAAALPPAPMPAARRRGPLVALAASIALAVVAASAVAALRSRAPHGMEIAPPPSPREVALARAPNLVSPAPSPPVAPQCTSTAKPQRLGRPATAQESYAAELDLLSRAQAAYADRNFADVLALVAEHGRRYPNGRLAEEREALRVRSLAGSGRANEARRAATAFVDRFPRSVFLPRLGVESR
jgi:hypothetical protein